LTFLAGILAGVLAGKLLRGGAIGFASRRFIGRYGGRRLVQGPRRGNLLPV
jgi:hypothetical protein